MKDLGFRRITGSKLKSMSVIMADKALPEIRSLFLRLYQVALPLYPRNSAGHFLTLVKWADTGES